MWVIVDYGEHVPNGSVSLHTLEQSLHFCTQIGIGKAVQSLLEGLDSDDDRCCLAVPVYDDSV